MAEKLCDCGKPLRHVGRCKGKPVTSSPAEAGVPVPDCVKRDAIEEALRRRVEMLTRHRAAVVKRMEAIEAEAGKRKAKLQAELDSIEAERAPLMEALGAVRRSKGKPAEPEAAAVAQATPAPVEQCPEPDEPIARLARNEPPPLSPDVKRVLDAMRGKAGVVFTLPALHRTVQQRGFKGGTGDLSRLLSKLVSEGTIGSPAAGEFYLARQQS